jgi:hypothetical protein
MIFQTEEPLMQPLHNEMGRRRDWERQKWKGHELENDRIGDATNGKMSGSATRHRQARVEPDTGSLPAEGAMGRKSPRPSAQKFF